MLLLRLQPPPALVLGASGLVGGNCLAVWQAAGAPVLGTYFSFHTPGTVYFDTLNLQNPANAAVASFAPHYIIHCGALTHVDYCEQHPEESYRQTVLSTHNAVQLCQQLGAKLVYVSTDYVFDGQAGPYQEAAAVNPLSVYARHKLEAESYALQALDGTLVIRVTNVYGSEVRNKNFVARIVQRLQAGEAVTLRLPQDQYATPANAWDIARALAQLTADGHTGIYHLASTDFCNRVQLAQRIQRHFPAAELTIEAVPTAQLQQPAARPLLGGLIAAKFLTLYPSFHFSNVDDFLGQLASTTT